MAGTQKGLFLFKADKNRQNWEMSGPHLSGWDIYSLYGEGGASQRLWAGTSHYSYGPTFRVSDDLGQTWQQFEARPQYPADTGWKLNRIWQITPHPTERNTLFAGVEEAGLFVSRDRGQSWQEIEALTRQPGRDKWFPGNGGLCLHTILIDPKNPQRMWVGISAVGVFRTEDAGESWTNLNKGLPNLASGSDEPESMACIHKMVLDPKDPNTVYMQYHGGVFRSHNAGDDWIPAETGLPGNFGFPMVITKKGDLFIAPLKADEHRFFPDGKAAIYRSTDSAKSWHATRAGLPTDPYFAGVLRDAMATDEANGVYFGTTMGDVFGTQDGGENWQKLPGKLPRVHTVKTVVIE
jgi:photosystem II stability/assembly factor-like uncharacterized protein